MKKYFNVKYTTKMGKNSDVNVIANNNQEAIRNAKNILVTGRDFHSPVEISKPEYTAKGTGIAIGR